MKYLSVAVACLLNVRGASLNSREHLKSKYVYEDYEPLAYNTTGSPEYENYDPLPKSKEYSTGSGVYENYEPM